MPPRRLSSQIEAAQLDIEVPVPPRTERGSIPKHILCSVGPVLSALAVTAPESSPGTMRGSTNVDFVSSRRKLLAFDRILAIACFAASYFVAAEPCRDPSRRFGRLVLRAGVQLLTAAHRCNGIRGAFCAEEVEPRRKSA